MCHPAKALSDMELLSNAHHAATATSLLPPAVAPVLAPRFFRLRVLQCRGPGFTDAADEAGRMGEGEASVGGDG